MTKPSRILSLLSLVPLSLLVLIPGCGQGSSPLESGSRLVATDQVALEGGGAGGGGNETIYTLQVKPGASVAAVAARNGASLIEVDEESGTGTYSSNGIGGDDPLMDIMQDQDTDHSGPLIPAVLTGPVNTLYGFHQDDTLEEVGYEWTDDMYYAQPNLACMNLTEVRGVPSTQRGPIVAVLDTGVDPRHPHLARRIITLNPRDAVRLEQFEYAPDGVGTDAAFGHGTHIAGSILAVAPEAWILPLKVLNDDGVGDDHTVAVALDIAKKYGARIINLSLVIEGVSELVEERLGTLVDRDTHVVAAAGNEAGPPGYPASNTSVVAVGATNLCTQLTSWTASGQLVDFTAPGAAIVSSYPLDRGGAPRLAVATGTSTSCALTTGAYAAMLSKYTVNPDPIKNLVMTAQPTSPQHAVRKGAVSPFHAMGLSN